MLEAILFYVFAFASVFAGVAILFSRQIVRIAYWLIAMLASVAGLYFLLGANFLGGIQLIVYVGGVAVLVVFGVMLSSRRMASEIFARGWELVLSAALGLVLLGGLVVAVVSGKWFVVGSRSSSLSPEPSVENLSKEVVGRFIGPFELASVLLLLVLLGAGYLARPRTPRAGSVDRNGGSEGGGA